MTIDRRRLFQRIAIIGAIAAFATIVLGGTVRGMGAGLACPDWPLCHGSVVPDLADPLIAVEYIHRLVAALTSVSLLLTMVLAFLWYRAEMRLVTLSSMSFAILVAQVAFGALTITSSLDWVVVTIHLTLGTATFGSALIVALVSIWPSRPGTADSRTDRASLDEEMDDADGDEADRGPDRPAGAAVGRREGEERPNEQP